MKHKKFSATHTKQGVSFVESTALHKAKEKAYKKGYNCEQQTMYHGNTWKMGNTYFSYVEIECVRQVCNDNDEFFEGFE